MEWTVLEHPDFSDEISEMDEDVMDKLFEVISVLEELGPRLGRPLVDTLKDSKHKNMKEIRFALKGAWRFAFAFDRDQQAIVLCGGTKEGVSQRKFYKQLIRKADERFDDWLDAAKEKEQKDG